MSAYGCFADVYDRLTSNINYEELALYYDRIISNHNGKKGILLDLACGTGSMSMQFSKLGYDVIGVDLSTEMLSIAKEKPHDNIEYLCQDMCELDMYGTVDVTGCVLDSINHLKAKKDVEKAISATLETVKEEVAKGGKVQVVGFGTFEARTRKARMGKNPQTKQAVEIPAATVPAFKAGKAFKDVVNAK